MLSIFSRAVSHLFASLGEMSLLVFCLYLLFFDAELVIWVIVFSRSVVSNSSDAKDCNTPGCCVHVIFQARILELVAISYSKGYSWLKDWTHVSCIIGGFFTTEPLWPPSCVECMQILNSLQWKQLNLDRVDRKPLHEKCLTPCFLFLYFTSSIFF